MLCSGYRSRSESTAPQMNIATSVRRRLRSLFRRDDVESELSDEIRLHLDMETEDLVRQGHTREAARREARLRLGGVDKTMEDCRDVDFVVQIIEVQFTIQRRWVMAGNAGPRKTPF